MALVFAVHAAVLAWMIHASPALRQQVTPVLVSMITPAFPPPVTEPAPPPKPAPAVSRPEPMPRAPAPSPPVAVAPQPTSITAEAPAVEATVAAPAPAPARVVESAPAPAATFKAPESPPAPVVQPRFDAAYLNNPQPEYPRVSKRMGEQGRVLLRVYVSAAGKPERIEVGTSSGSSRLDDAARQAVVQWKFVPARQGDVPVAAWVIVPITFVLEG